MDATKIGELASLLRKAMQSVEIKRRSSNQIIDGSLYRQNMIQCWHSYNPDLHLYMRSFKIHVRDSTAWDTLLAFVKQELGDFILEGRIQTASFAVHGGFSDGFPLDYLLSHLLRLAIVRGEIATARSFYECTERTHASYRQIVLLNGVRAESGIQVSQGIRIIPLPNSTSELPSYLPHMGPIPAERFLGRTLMVINHSISPIFMSPGAIRTFQDTEESFHHEIACAEHPNFDLSEFCEALSLTCDASIQWVATWSHLDNDEIFNVNGVSGGMSYRKVLLHDSHSVLVSEKEVGEAMCLYITRKNINSATRRKLKVPIDRWIKSKDNSSHVDTFIDLGITLESLYLEDIGKEDRGGGNIALGLASVRRGIWGEIWMTDNR